MNKLPIKKTDKTVATKDEKARSKSKVKEEKKPEKIEKVEKPEKIIKGKKKEEESSEGEEVKVKKALSAYNFFSQEIRVKVKKDNPGIKNTEIMTVK